MITLWQAVVMAVVQGIAEFFPVSSTAHLILIPWLYTQLGWGVWNDPGLTFDVALHAGTLLAVLGFFFTTWVRIIRAGFGAPVDIHNGRVLQGAALQTQRRLLWLIALATVPGALVGAAFEKHIDSDWRNPLVIAASLIVVGILMGWADREPAQKKDFDQTSPWAAWGIGCAQALAVIPGVSRSGATITAGLFSGMTREAAARFSFLLATPIIAGAVLKKLLEVHKTGIPTDMHAQFVAGVVVSTLVGIASIGLFVRFLKSGTLRFFVYYRIILGLAVIALYLHGFRTY